MNILQITKKFPWPVKDGEVIGIFNLTKGFAHLGHPVTVLCLNTNKHYFPLDKIPVEVAKLAKFEAVDINTDIKAIDAFLNLFTDKSYNIERFYSQAFEQKIAETLDNGSFDLILLEGIYLMRYIDVIRKHTKAKVALRPHNVEFVIWERLHETEKNPLKKLYLRLLAGRMRRFELSHINLADMLVPVSATDMNIFMGLGCTLPNKALPIGYDFDELPAISALEENAVAFIGGMDWMPNREGIDWFIKKVWPQVTAQIPNAKFYLAGRNFPTEIKNLEVKGLTVVGEVDNAQEFILSKAVSIVPLFAGSGMRVKIVEAMALGRAIISTTVGAESLAYTDGLDILIADDAAKFAMAIIKVLQDKNARIALGNNAQKLVSGKYDNRKISAALLQFCKPELG